MVDKIDEGLKSYYESIGVLYTNPDGIGRFKSFCLDNGFEDEDITEEIQAGAKECMLVDFDEDPDGINRFPLKISMFYEQELLTSGFVRKYMTNYHYNYNNINKLPFSFIPRDIIKLFANWFCLVDIESIGDKTEEIFKIISYIHHTGKPPSKRLVRTNNILKPIKLKLTSNFITYEIIQKCKKIYKQQCPRYIQGPLKESNIMYFIAARYVNDNIPYFSNIVDSYNRARVVSKFKGNNYALTTSTWRSQNTYIKDLAKINYKLAENLECAVRTYCTKNAPPVQFNPLYKINDSLAVICEYIVGVSQFVKILVDKCEGHCPFQLDMCIAMDVIDACKFSYEDSDTGMEEDEEWDYMGNQMKIDFIGNIESKLNHEKCKNYSKILRGELYEGNENNNNDIFINDNEKMKEMINKIYIMDAEFIQFYNATHPNWKLSNDYYLDEMYDHYDDDDDGNKDENNEMSEFLNEMFNEFKAIRNEGKSTSENNNYPQNKRFCLFIDRRHKSNENNKNIGDKVTFYEPPDVCANIPNNHVSEWYFESVRKCIIPRKGFGDGTNERDVNMKSKPYNTTINSQSTVCGKLMTFSFHVESKESVKCYLYWSGQTQRFLPMDIQQLLPSLFVDSIENVV